MKLPVAGSICTLPDDGGVCRANVTGSPFGSAAFNAPVVATAGLTSSVEEVATGVWFVTEIEIVAVFEVNFPSLARNVKASAPR